MRLATLAAFAVLTANACQGRDVSRIASGAGSTGSSGAATSGGISASSSASSTGTSTAASSSGATGTGTGGTTTGGSSSGTSTGSPYWDGGYVFCSVALAADGGINSDGGPASWLCTPGTYFCDITGKLGNCFQCLSDSDCTNQALPTYDLARPHCDLDSGVNGYENYCQVCLTSADCEGRSSGPFCNLQVSDDPDTIEAPTEDLGFETCGPALEDCRVDGGPACNGINGYCDSENGRCELRSGDCTTNAQCVGVVDTTFPYLLDPVCVNGFCASCDAGDCLSHACSSDSDCGGFVPACVNGTCSCDREDQCSDAGLVCVPPPYGFGIVAFCGLPCTAPSFPPCSLIAYGNKLDTPICDSTTGLCAPCTTDQECRSGVETGGPTCLTNGGCGCAADSDCPSDKVCQLSDDHAICVPRSNGCTIQSCSGLWCDWDSGECASDNAGQPGQPCHDDYDCSHGFLGADYCDPKSGSCVYCRDDADCEHQDGGFGFGTSCVVDDGGHALCGYRSDQACVGIGAGSRCVTNPDAVVATSCGCLTAADCAPGEACGRNRCYATTQQCSSDDECSTNFFCEKPFDICRPRCDTGHACQAPDLICDTNDDTGQNFDGSTYCFQCLKGSDCPEGEGCSAFSCGLCDFSSQCRAGEVCTRGRLCLPACVQGVCPSGQVCDTNNTVGQGYDLCYQCLTAADCPGDQGCNSLTLSCGTCRFPVADYGANLSDCPPGDICSDFWSGYGLIDGVCLPNCDRTSCPADKPICAVLPALTPDHHYCFGCLTDSDCTDAGPGAWCDVSVGMTFSCQPP